MNPTKLIFPPTPSSKVEQYFLKISGKEFIYRPIENIPVIQVANFPVLGKLTSLRFIEWILENPEGVISLPTGKTPEHFIKWTGYFLQNWESDEVQAELKKVGIISNKAPSLENIKFVQIDEFYPINSSQHNSFYYYVQKYYLKSWGLKPENALLIDTNKIGTANNLPLDKVFTDDTVDLELRTRFASNSQERLQKETLEIVDEFCTEYEQKIRNLGGIGFFLGGIGPDGHIGFNVKGSDQFSTTRLTATNYETQAAAAGDLGGIEVARKRLVITIGLDTIAYNPDAVAIIIAAGEAKANIIRDSIQNKRSNKHPATVLQQLKNSRFYLTNGAALRLSERRLVDVKNTEKLNKTVIERAVINLCMEKRKPLDSLTEKDYLSDKLTKVVLSKTGRSFSELNTEIRDSLINRFNKGMKFVENERFLHTAPHHDDIMLGYLPYLNHLVRTPFNKHHFVYLTSGFNAVTNNYVLELLCDLRGFIDSGDFEKRFQNNYFDPGSTEGKNRDVNLYLDGVARHSRTLKNEATSRRLLRILIEIYEEDNVRFLLDRIEELSNYFRTQYPGKKDISDVQKLKGMLREWEVEILWASFGFGVDHVDHLRLGFYKGDIFTENPKMDRDVIPILNLLKKVKPTILTVALDPEGSGPDTHYKVLQAIAEALRLYEKEADISYLKIWGYRNVWYKFHPSEANLYVPVSLNSFSILEKTFMYSFGSQKNASFPSYEFDGPFYRLAQQIQAEQYSILRTCLGKDYFLNNNVPRARAAKGMVFINELSVSEFYKHSMRLKKLTENI